MKGEVISLLENKRYSSDKYQSSSQCVCVCIYIYSKRYDISGVGNMLV